MLGAVHQREAPQWLALGLSLGLLLVGCALLRPMEQRAWTEVESDHLTLLTDSSQSSALRLTHELERFRALVIRLMDLPEPPEAVPTTVFLFEKGPADLRFTLSGALGFVLDTPHRNYITIDARFGDAYTRQSAFHELVHVLLLRRLYPVWYHEGIATALSTSRFGLTRAEVGRAPPHVLGALRRRSPMPFEELSAVTRSSGYSTGKLARSFYSSAWALAHYLTFGSSEMNLRLGRFLELWRAGTEPTDAFSAAFEQDSLRLQRKVDRYLAADSLPGRRVDLSRANEPNEPQVRAAPMAAVCYRLGELASQWGIERAELAERLLRCAVAEDPSDALAHAVLAKVQHALGRAEQAEDRFLHALTLDPGSVRVHALYGQHFVERARGSESEVDRQALLARARSHFRRSIESEPNSPAAHFGLGTSYLLDGEDPLQGLDAMERARTLLPSNADVSYALAQLCVRAGRTDQARLLLGEVIHFAAHPDLASRAQLALHQLSLSDE
jgi:Tfp pilus assembly protein PilF